jgi:UDP:flavonoid glycosyltransferase YjiC (YdhE family)
MHLTIVAIGSRGDIQPYIALGEGLQQAGQRVRLNTHHDFEALVREHGLEFAPLHGNVRDLMSSEAGVSFAETGANPIKFVREFRSIARTLIVGMLGDCLEACADTDLIVMTGIGFYAAYPVAEKLGKPYLQAYLQPVTPTCEFTMSVIRPLKLGGAVNYASYFVGGQMFWQAMRGALNDARREVLNLPPTPFFGPFARLYRDRAPVIYGYSPSVLPRPNDWPDFVHVTGYWFLDQSAGWQPPQELTDFLAAGSPPIAIGFGSMNNRDPEHTTEIVLKALECSQQRGLLLTGWGGLHQSALPDHVFKIDFVPHEWLFPRMGAIVHHGGAGTTAAALRSGVPSIGIPFFADQPFWAEHAYRLGVGPRPLPRKKLSAEKLAEAIQLAVTEQSIRRRAAHMGELLRSEDGVQRAVEIFQRYYA